jgi:hypothetical protein
MVGSARQAGWSRRGCVGPVGHGFVCLGRQGAALVCPGDTRRVPAVRGRQVEVRRGEVGGFRRVQVRQAWLLCRGWFRLYAARQVWMGDVRRGKPFLVKVRRGRRV